MALFAAATLPCGSWREIQSTGKSTPVKSGYTKTRSARSRNLHKFTKFTDSKSSGTSPPDRAKPVSYAKLYNSFKGGSDIAKRDQTVSSGVFYEPKATTHNLKLEMEVFGDLSGFCQSTKAMAAKFSQNDADELNTPVFEKAPFDYDRPSNSSNLLDVVISAEDPFNYKIKSEPLGINNVNIEDNLMITEDNVAYKESEYNKDISNMPVSIVNTQTGKPVNNYIVISSQDISNTNNSNVLIPNHSAEYEDIYNSTSDKVTPIYEEMFNEDDEYLPTVNNYSDIFFNNANSYIDIGNDNTTNSQIDNSSTEQDIILHTAPFETPDNSRSASDCSGQDSPNLTLDIDKKFKCTDVLDTPDVVYFIDSIENEKGFNILNFLTDEDIHAIEPALTSLDVPVISSSSTTVTITPEETNDNSTKASTTLLRHTQKRKARRNEDDDDEDYVPPCKKRTVYRKTAKAQQKPVLYDSNTSDDDDEELVKPARRGRPPKRNISISSEDTSVDGKYREMRDKNNEASRKSRLKRKVKELAQEEEMQQLEERNTKLKAQVEHLDKTVNNFRNNLMQILLKK